MKKGIARFSKNRKKNVMSVKPRGRTNVSTFENAEAHFADSMLIGMA